MSGQPPYGYDPSFPQQPFSTPLYTQNPSSPQQPGYPPPPPAYPSPPPYSPPPGYPLYGPYAPPSVPLYPGMPFPPPDQGAGLALAGFVCGLSGVVLPVLAFVLLGTIRLSAIGALLLLAAFPAAIVGLVLSAVGRRSVSRRGFAIAGIVLSIVSLAVLALLVGLVILAAIAYSTSSSG